MKNNLKLISNIDESLLDNNYYYSSLIEYALSESLISTDQYNFIKLQELELISLKIKSITGEDYSSIKIDKAAEINENNIFILSYYLKSFNNPDIALEELMNSTLPIILKKGEILLSKDLNKQRMFINVVISNMLNLTNIAYQETFKVALKEALKKYNFTYYAHDKIITGDYTTSIYPKTIGLEFIKDYMNNFNIENLFLQNYDTKLINDLLYRISPDSPHLLFNIYEYVIINSILSSLIDYDITNLYIDSVGKELIYLKLIDKNEDEIKEIIYPHLKRIIKEFNLSDNITSYIMNTLDTIELRIINAINNDSLDNLIP